MVTMDRGGRVRTLEEKPERSSATHASMGIYVFEFDTLREMLRSRPVDLVLDVLRPLVDAGERVYAHEFNGFWEDVGTVASFYRANLELVQPEPRLQLYDSRWPILTRDEERPAVLLSDSASIEDSLVANGCVIEGRVERSILFPGVRVGPGAVVSDAVVMSDVKLEAGSRVNRAILDKYARVGEGAVVGDGDDPGPSDLQWLAGLVLVGKDAWIPPGGRVMRPASIGVGGRYEDFADGTLPAGTVVGNRRWYEELR
jgi:glucose-1-phosphate adenylyltransferase